MKFLYLSLIALGMICIFSTSAYALHPMSIPVLYMKSNTIGHIYVKFSTFHHNQTINLGPMVIYDANLTNHVPLNLTDLSVIPNRTSITLDSNDTIVDYTVTAKNNLKGMYALPVDHFTDHSSVIWEDPLKKTIHGYSKADCGMIPLVIGLNDSQVKDGILDEFTFFNTSKNCPVPLVDRWYTGSQTIERMPGSYLVGVSLVHASMDKSVYFLGDTATVRGYLYTNDTNVTIGLEKDYSTIVESKNVPVMQNGTFAASFIIPTNYANTWSVTVSSKNAGTLALDLNFESLPLKQYKTGTAAKNVVCKQEYQLIFKSEDDSPACVKPDTAKKLIERGWARIIVTKASFDVIQSNTTRTDSMEDLGTGTGIVNWKNQTYYFETPNYTKTTNATPMKILFHGVLFTLFPSTFGGMSFGECKGTYYLTDAKFSDGTSEVLDVFVGSSCGYDYTPIKLSTHTNPQAGLIFYDGKMKLLVSTNPIDSDEHNIMIQPLGQTPDVSNKTDITKLRVHLSGGSGSINRGSDKFNQTGFFSGNVGQVINKLPVEVNISDPYDMFVKTYEIPSTSISQDGSFNFTHTFIGKYDQDVYTLDFSYGNQKYELKYYPVIPPLD